jgi:hypothetical protein
LGERVSTAHTAFYATAATVIPVLVVAYMVGMGALARRISDRLARLGAEGQAAIDRRIDAEVKDAELAMAQKNFYRALTGGLPRYVGTGLAPLFLVIGAVPFVGEVCALIALSSDRATHAILVLTWIGLGTACLLTLGPLWEALVLMYRPGAMFGLVRPWWALLRQQRRVEKAEREGKRRAQTAPTQSKPEKPDGQKPGTRPGGDS